MKIKEWWRKTWNPKTVKPGGFPDFVLAVVDWLRYCPRIIRCAGCNRKMWRDYNPCFHEFCGDDCRADYCGERESPF